MPKKTVRAYLSEREYMQFNILAAKRGLSRTLLTLRVIQEYLVSQARVERYMVDPVAVPVETKTIKINTRQYARLKKLQVDVPGCSCEVLEVEDVKNIMLTYPLSREADVLKFLADCPKGSRKESKVFKKMDPTATPGLKAARRKKEESEGATIHSRIIMAAEKILMGSPLPFEDLYSQLKALKRIPGGFNPKPILRRLLKESQLFDLSSDDTYSIRVECQEESTPEPEDPTPNPASEAVIEAPPISETRIEVTPSKPEGSIPKVPVHFPRWSGS